MFGRAKLAKALLAASLASLALTGVGFPQETAPPPETRIVFQLSRGNFNELFMVPVHLGTRVSIGKPDQLTSTRGDEENHPVWSADGNRIAFARYAGGSRSWSIFVMNADGTGRRNLSRCPEGFYDEVPRWAPDDEHIVFTRTSVEDDSTNIMVAKTDGSSVVHLVEGNDPSWSPDGSQILYTDAQGHIAVTSSVSGAPTTTLTDGEASDFLPSLSPDGTKIFFTRRLSGAFEKGDVYVMNADGSGIQRLTDTPERFEIARAWSPDSSKIVYTSYRETSSKVLAIEADGTDPQRLGPRGPSDYPAWAPDGSGVALTHYSRDGSHIYFVPLDGSQVSVLATFREGELLDLQWAAVQPEPPSPSPTST
ncbi:MAG TPA: hypothetical protein VNC78_11005 [Actinomycetota bacterium]|nr:hypothetical protein [Actinomycetota bacterium]